MRVASLQPFVRPHVTAALRVGNAIWLGTHGGLFRWSGERAQPEAFFEGREVRAIGPCPQGFCIAAKVDHQFRAFICAPDGKRLSELPLLPENDEPKCINGGQGFWLGGKNGVYHLVDERWRKVYDPGRCDTVALIVHDNQVCVSIKKHGAAETPAFVVSRDNGRTWTEEASGCPRDLVLTASATRAITRWQGVCLRGQSAPSKALAVSAGTLDLGDGSAESFALIQGCELRVHRPGRADLRASHALFAECEILLADGDRMLLAGPQGAYALHLGSGEVRDVFDGVAFPATSGKIRKIYDLGGGRLLATASFGTFISIDGGDWQPVQSDWTLLDCQAVVRIDADTHYMITKRALFKGSSNGTEWHYIHPETQPHHLGDLSGLFSTGEYLLLATHASGLFTAPLNNPARLQFVKAGGRQAVKAAVAISSTEVMIATPEFRIHNVNLENGVFSVMARLPAIVEGLYKHGDEVLAATKHAMYALSAAAEEHGFRDITPPAAQAPLHACAMGDQVLVWDDHHAWARVSPSGAWVLRPEWPEVVKKAVLLQNEGCAVATDNRYIYRLPLLPIDGAASKRGA